MERDNLEEQVVQFMQGKLPGQPMIAHMGTTYLVNDLWREVQRLRQELKTARQGARKDGT